MKKNILVIGNGAFGIAMSQILLNNDQTVFLYSKNPIAAKKIASGKHDLYPFEKLIVPTKIFTNYKEAFQEKIDIIVLCVPSVAINDIYKEIKLFLKPNMIIINTAKGLNQKHNDMWSELFLKNGLIKEYALLVGPSFASEIVKKNKTIINVVSNNVKTSLKIQKLFNNDYFKLIPYKNEFVASLISSFKNALAVGLGLLDAITHSINTKSAYLTIALNEINLLINKITNSCETQILNFFGVGDIYLTCTSDESRNYQFGKLVGEHGVETANLQTANTTVEGYRTIKRIYKLIKDYKIIAPFFESLYKICYKSEKATNFVDLIWKKFN